MSLSHSPKISTDGLVFYYDQNNIQKSWRGAPATNLFTETNLNNWSKNATVSTTQFITPFDTPSYIITDDDTANWESINRSITVTNDSSSHTISLMVRKTFGGTSTRLGFNVSYSGGTAVNINARFNSDTGVTTDGLVIDYGDWWYWYFSITNNSTGNTSLNYNFYPATGVHNGSDNSTVTGTAIVGAFMLVAGSVAARFASGTRSNTQAILDLTRGNSITANSLTYAANDSFSFNGSSDFMSLNYIGSSPAFTHEVFLRPTDATKDQMYIGYNTLTAHYVRIVNSQAFLSVSANGQKTMNHTQILANNTNYHIVSIYNGIQLKIYVNGVVNNGSVINQPLAGWGMSRIGRWQDGDQRSFVGNIFNMKTYNRELTEAEIQQNFNALRGRYGI